MGDAAKTLTGRRPIDPNLLEPLDGDGEEASPPVRKSSTNEESFFMGDADTELPLEDDAPPAPIEPKKDEAWRSVPSADGGGPPKWAKIPKGMKFPRGRQVIFLRFPGEWTDTPKQGERQAILWTLTDADEKLAFSRAMSDANRAPGQLAKQMLRAVDGYESNWTGEPGPGNIDQWWSDIGGKCRSQIIRLYGQLHVLGTEEQKHFFENCIAVRSTG